jgi:prepilin peptidase CpaA
MLVAVVLTAIAAVWDHKTGEIPNWLTMGAVAGGIVGHTLYGWHVAGFKTGLVEGATSVAGLLFCSLAPAFMYWKGGMGGGDLKLYAGLGALCHPMLGIEMQMYSLIVAAIAAPARLAYEGRLFQVLSGSFAVFLNPFRAPEKRRAIPTEATAWFRMGPAIFGGALLTLLIHSYAAPR